jgi:RNA polymerase primary sigma factor
LQINNGEKVSNTVTTKSSTSTVREQDATKLYLREVSRSKLLNHAQEIQLSQTIENSRREIVLNLLAIPLCSHAFCESVDAVVSGAVDVDTLIDMLAHEQDDIMTKLADASEMVKSLAQVENSEQFSELAAKVADLPFVGSFWDKILHPVQTLVKNNTAISGAFLRFAQSCGISRQDFLSNYQNPAPSKLWTKFAQANCDQVEKFQSQLDGFAKCAGLSAQDLTGRISKIRDAQKIRDQAVSTMLQSNLRLVVSVAKRYLNVSPTPLLDLVQEGNIGLLKAIEKYNWRLGYRFSTYATWWIKQCVLKALNEQHRVIRVPTHMTDLVKRVSRAREELMGQNGYEPSPVEIAENLGVNVAVVNKVWTVAQGTISLETPIGSEDDSTLANVIEDQNSFSSFDHIAEVDTQNAVNQVLGQLSPKEERVVRMRFGLGVDSECTLEDIGNRFGVTRERVRQIEQKALEKLKEPDLAKQMLAAFE